jgi:Insertion element 4 transposase N-terminal
MARTATSLSAEARVTDYISLGVITSAFPAKAIQSALARTGKGSVRERELPAQVVMYYVIAQALFMQLSQREVLRCLLEGVRWLFGLRVALKVTGKSGISQARSRLGWEPVKQLHDEVVKPIAVKKTRGAWYKNWQLVSLDGSTLEVADTQENQQAYGRPGASRGRSAYPQIRFVSIVENGIHLLFGTAMAGYSTGEISLTKAALTGISILNPDSDCYQLRAVCKRKVRARF